MLGEYSCFPTMPLVGDGGNGVKQLRVRGEGIVLLGENGGFPVKSIALEWDDLCAGIGNCLGLGICIDEGEGRLAQGDEGTEDEFPSKLPRLLLMLSFSVN